MKACVRCGQTDELEADHILPKHKGGPDTKDNLRWLCRGCHDYRHARDNVINEIGKMFSRQRYRLKGDNGADLTGRANPAQLTMWLFRLGVLEFFNQPEAVKKRGYMSYGELPETLYERWYEQIKIARKSGKDEQLQKFVSITSYEPGSGAFEMYRLGEFLKEVEGNAAL
jgi:HNH endonuclease